MAKRRQRPRAAVASSPALSARLAAVQCLTGVLQHGRSLTEVLPATLRDSQAQRSLAQELSYGVLRWHGRLSAVAARLLTKPLRSRDHDMQLLLETGLYQLLHADVPPQWVVSECVDVARLLDKPWAAGLLNATLRRFTRESDAMLASVDAEPAARFSHPAWLVERLQQAWPEDWRAIVAANNQRPPMTVRVNRLKGDVSAYQAELAAAGMQSRAHALAPQALTLDEPVAVEHLPGFNDGRCSVQDAGAQLAALLLDAQPGNRVLDACAAPGGKSGHILELQPELSELVAVDNEAHRLARVEENLRRLGQSARLREADVGDVDRWWDGHLFDRILLDAPCTATGVIRRHPDIKWLRRPRDDQALALTQQQLLLALWPLLAPGGKLVYCTCSVMPTENDAVVGALIDGAGGVARADIEMPWGTGLRHGRQILPGEHGMDGFYYAVLVKSQ